MKKIEDLFTDFFNERKITNERLGSYGLDHVARITANNNPASTFAAIIANTNNALSAFGTAVEAVGGSIGNRKGSTSTKNLARMAFNAFIRQKEGTIKGQFGETSEPYIQFFPDGLSVYNKATDLKYKQLIDNIIARATQYQAQLGVAFLNDATTLGNAYKNAEDSQTTEKGDVSNAEDTLAAARIELTTQLTINALTIALQFPLQPEKVTVYFDTSLLFAQKRKHIYKGTPAAGTKNAVAKVEYDAGKIVRMQNKGAAPLEFQMTLLNSYVGNSFTLAPGEKLQKRMDEFFSNADALYVTNNGTVTGQYVVTVVA